MLFNRDEQLVEELTTKFCELVKVHTTSDPYSEEVPSTSRQWDLANLLRQELSDLGAEDVTLSDTCVVSGYFAASEGCQSWPTVALIAHIDTSSEAPGDGVEPRVQRLPEHVESDIALPKPNRSTGAATVIGHKDLEPYGGCTVVTGSGDTLIGADDKLGVAALLAVGARLRAMPHGRVRLLFTPDEEIGGTSAALPDGKVADLALTVDGGPVGEISVENFSAISFKAEFAGRNVHPGIAGEQPGLMASALAAAADFVVAAHRELPRPDTSRDKEGFIHFLHLDATVTSAKVEAIVRDFDSKRVRSAAERLGHLAAQSAERFGLTVEGHIREQYTNMLDYIPRWLPDALIQSARAVLSVGEVTVGSGEAPQARLVPIRGGTDGSYISASGCPCPNVWAGMHNYHSEREFAVMEENAAAVRMLLHLLEHLGDYAPRAK